MHVLKVLVAQGTWAAEHYRTSSHLCQPSGLILDNPAPRFNHLVYCLCQQYQRWNDCVSSGVVTRRPGLMVRATVTCSVTDLGSSLSRMTTVSAWRCQKEISYNPSTVVERHRCYSSHHGTGSQRQTYSLAWSVFEGPWRRSAMLLTSYISAHYFNLSLWPSV